MEGTEEEEQVYEDQESYDDLNEDYPNDSYDDEGFVGEGSEPPPLGGIYGLFKDVKDAKDTKKVSNLKDEELGLWDISELNFLPHNQE